MLPSPRALLGVAPAVLVLAGSYAMSRQAKADADAAAESAQAPVRGEMVAWPTADDDERLHRVALKQETVEDLMDGRLTLEAAVERFEHLMSSPDSQVGLRVVTKGATDRERVVNQILSFAKVQASWEPQRFTAPLARVRAEARAYLAAHRTGG